MRMVGAELEMESPRPAGDDTARAGLCSLYVELNLSRGVIKKEGDADLIPSAHFVQTGLRYCLMLPIAFLEGISAVLSPANCSLGDNNILGVMVQSDVGPQIGRTPLFWDSPWKPFRGVRGD
jgi:hypothetical protein